MRRTLGTSVLLGLPVATMLGLASASGACEPQHRLRRISPTPVVTPPGGITPSANRLCWGGRCETHGKDGPDTWGQFKVDRMPSANHDLDHITMRVVKQGGGEEIILAKVSNPVCSPPAATAAGCSERYRLIGITACPLNQAPCANSNKVSAPIASLDQINTLTNGGCITLSDGQQVCGSKRRDFWLFYDVCCPDNGQFGAPGEIVNTTVSYTFQLGGNAQTCMTDFPRPQAGFTEPIPASGAAPCG